MIKKKIHSNNNIKMENENIKLNTKINKNEIPAIYIFAVILFLSAALFRIFSILPNVSPVMAIALLGPVIFPSKKMGFLIPIAIMFVSDLLLGLHSTMPFVYISFGITALMGLRLKGMLNKKSENFGSDNGKMTGKIWFSVATASVLGSIVFFVFTNFGVWLVSGMYAHNSIGLIQCFTNALPFFRNSLWSNLGFTMVMFAPYYFIVLRARRTANTAA